MMKGEIKRHENENNEMLKTREEACLSPRLASCRTCSIIHENRPKRLRLRLLMSLLDFLSILKS